MSIGQSQTVEKNGQPIVSLLDTGIGTHDLIVHKDSHVCAMYGRIVVDEGESDPVNFLAVHGFVFGDDFGHPTTYGGKTHYFNGIIGTDEDVPGGEAKYLLPGAYKDDWLHTRDFATAMLLVSAPVRWIGTVRTIENGVNGFIPFDFVLDHE